jgi:IS1 family transposase
LVWYGNDDYLNRHRNDDSTVELVPVTEAERGSFVRDQYRQSGLWRALDHTPGEPLAFHFGTGKPENRDELVALLQPFAITIVYADNNVAYQSVVLTAK